MKTIKLEQAHKTKTQDVTWKTKMEKTTMRNAARNYYPNPALQIRITDYKDLTSLTFKSTNPKKPWAPTQMRFQ